jgi:hypothetical protein
MSGRLIAILICLAACEHGKGGGVFDADEPDPGFDASGGSGIQCGGFAGIQCPADEFCDFQPNNCGGTDEQGTCKTRPRACDLLLDPVCGCDGQMHDNACFAAMKGFDVDGVGLACPR